MNIDFELLTEHFTFVVVIACLVIGYVLKHASFLKWIPNNDIPIILGVFGAIFNVLTNGFSLESIVYGAVIGLASTGLHQAFKGFVENNKNAA